MLKKFLLSFLGITILLNLAQAHWVNLHVPNAPNSRIDIHFYDYYTGAYKGTQPWILVQENGETDYYDFSLYTGLYKIRISINGRDVAAYHKNASTFATAERVTLDSSVDEDLDLYFQIEEGKKLEGTIQDINGSPLVNMPVELYEAVSNLQLAKVTTNASGLYSFSGTHGDYFIRAGGNGYFPKFYSSNSATGAYGYDDRTTINVGTVDVTGRDIRLHTQSSISGSLPGGAGATINAFLADEIASNIFTYVNNVTLTGTSFTIPVPAGVLVVLQAEQAGKFTTFYGNGTSTGYGGKAATPRSGGDTANFSVALPTAGNITGVVTVPGSAGIVTISAFIKGAEHNFVNEVTANIGTTYTLPIPLANNVMVMVSRNNYATVYYNQKSSWDKSDAINASAGNINFTMTQTALITGAINVPSGTKVTIDAFERVGDTDVWRAQTVFTAGANNPAYELAAPVNKTYFLRAEAAGYFPMFYKNGAIAFGTDDREPVVLATSTVSGKNFIRPYDASSISGSLPSGAGATINAFLADGIASNIFTYVNNVTLNGTLFTLPVPAGLSVVLQAEQAGKFTTFYGNGKSTGYGGKTAIILNGGDTANFSDALPAAVTINGDISADVGATGLVTVSAFIYGEAHLFANETTANINGRYSLQIPLNNDVMIVASKNSYAKVYYNQQSGWEKATVINTAPAGDIDFTMTRTAPITGTVSVPAGTKVTVDAFERVDGTDVWVAQTVFTAGQNPAAYEMAVPVNKTYFLRAEAGGYFPVYYKNGDAAFGPDDRESVAIGTSTVSGKNFSKMYALGYMSGNVKYRGGANISGVTVNAFKYNTDYLFVSGVTTDASGNFSLPIPANVSLNLQVTANYALGFSNGTWYPDQEKIASSSVFDKPTSNLQFLIDKFWTVRGTVTPTGIGAVVDMYEWTDAGIDWNSNKGWTTTNIDGTYELRGTADAKVLLRVSANNHVTLYSLNKKHDMADLVTANDRLSLVVDTVIDNADFTLAPALNIAGRITAAGGSGIVTVSIQYADGKYFDSVTLNGSGDYAFNRIPAGTWLVYAERNGCAAEYFGGISTQNATWISGSTSNINFEIGAPWTISGYVRNEGGQGIAGAIVNLWRGFQWDYDYVSGNTTDANGRYTIEGAGQRNVYARVSADGYEVQFYNNVNSTAEATPLNMVYGQATNIDFVLKKEIPKVYITGNINVPINTLVTINAFDDASGTWVAQTVFTAGANNPIYELAVPTGNTYYLNAEAGGYFPVFYKEGGAAFGDKDRDSVAVDEDAVGNKNFSKMYALGHLNGNVKYRNGDNISQVTINAFQYATDYLYVSGVNTDTEGNFSLPIPVGVSLNLQVTANYLLGFPSGTWYPDKEAIASSSVFDKSESGLQFLIDRFWTVKGTVSPNKIEAVVEMYEWTDSGIDWNSNKGWVTANQDGTYELRGASNAEVLLRVGTGNYVSLYSLSAKNDMLDLVTENDRLELIIDETYITNADFELKMGNTISGWVTANAGSGDITVSLQNTDGRYFKSVTLNKNGHFEFNGVPPDASWLVYAERSGCISEYYDGMTSTQNAVRISGSTSNINIVLDIDTPWMIEGIVLDENNMGIPGAVVDVWGGFHPSWDYINETKTDGSGYYQVTGNGLRDVYVRVSANGYENKYYDNQFTTTNANAISMTPGTNTANIDFKLEKVWRISGQVLDKDKNGLAGVAINILDEQGNNLGWNDTGADGRYEIASSNMTFVDTRLSLVFSKEGYISVTENIESNEWQGNMVYMGDVILLSAAPDPVPVPPGKKMEDTIISGPNPANPDEGPVHIGFILDGNYRVRVKVYTIGGELVYQDDRYFPADYGEFLWDGGNLYGRRVPNGVYLAYVEIDTGSKRIRKVLKIAILR